MVTPSSFSASLRMICILCWIIGSAQASSHRRQPIRTVVHPSDVSIEVINRGEHRRRTLCSDDSMVLQFSIPVSLKNNAPKSSTFELEDKPQEEEARLRFYLQPTRTHFLHSNAMITTYHSSNRSSTRSQALVSDQVLAYSGTVVLVNDAHPSAQEQAKNWANILIHHPYGSTCMQLSEALVWEGAFHLNGHLWHIKSLDSYHKLKAPHDSFPSSSIAPDLMGSKVVLWSDSMVQRGTSYSGHISHRGKMQQEEDPSNTTKWSTSGMATNSTMGNSVDMTLSGGSTRSHLLQKRQTMTSDIAGLTGDRVDYGSTIGSTDGCPKSAKMVYMGIAVDCTYMRKYGSVDRVRLAVLNNMHLMSSVYERTFNVSLGIVEINMPSELTCPSQPPSDRPWNVDCPDTSSSGIDINQRLNKFSQWRSDKGGSDGAGLWHLLTDCPDGTQVGVSWLGALCKVNAQQGASTGTTSGTGVTASTPNEWETMAHEIGHNFGAVHDCAPGCTQGDPCCPFSSSSCYDSQIEDTIMAPSSTSGSSAGQFSSCSIGNICHSLKGGGDMDTSCVTELGQHYTVSLNQCGNGIVEAGEECDPGQVYSPCCQWGVCKFSPGSVCMPTTSSPCCSTGCQFAAAGTTCSSSSSASVSSCSGSSAAIPPFRHPRHPSHPSHAHSDRRTSDPLLFPAHPQEPHPHPPAPAPAPPPRQPPLPIRYPPYPPPAAAGLPTLSPAIASFHNAALVYLHRGLAIQSIQHSHSPQPAPWKKDPQEPFLSAVVKGFNQILLLETGLEFAQPRQVMDALMTIVRQKLDHAHTLPDHPTPPPTPPPQAEIWAAAKHVIIHSALRPRMSCVGDWAWQEIARGNYARLVEVWAAMLDIMDRRHPRTSPNAPLTTIGLDQAFFTALVVVSSTLSTGPSLAHLVKSLVDRICSRVIPAESLDLNGLPQPDRARFFLRAVELGLLWRRPVEDEQQEHPDAPSEQDERIVHLIRRTFLAQNPHSLQYCLDLSLRIQEAVNGNNHQPGWLPVDWTQPNIHPPTPQDTPSTPAQQKTFQRDIVLTQKVVATLLTGFAENGMIEQVEEMIQFSRKLGGMNRYLWSSILRGLTKHNNAVMMKEFIRRMEVEDKVEVDFNMRCIMISGSIASDLDGALEEIDQLLIQSTTSSSTRKGADARKKSKLPMEAVNSIISGLLGQRMLERAESILSSLSDRLTPNTTTLNHFLNYHSRLPRPVLDDVLAHLKRFEALAVKPDVVSFTILLNILMKLGLGQPVISKLLLMMDQAGVEPNTITYGSIIHHLCRSGKIHDVEVAHQLLEEIEERGIATTDITYTALIQGFLRAHIQEHEASSGGMTSGQPAGEVSGSSSKLEMATELISRLKRRGGKLNQVIYNALLNALFSTGQYASGVEVFKLMKAELHHPHPHAHTHSNAPPPIQLYGNGLVDSYGIIFRRLIQFGQLDLFRHIYHDFFCHEHFSYVPPWIQKFIDRFENSAR
ncbi:hypothetical protein PCANC_14790 [Puccinia coronata f. sp. avenae]|uniref:Peptidase M12B domain-containing protein n=1 Tax=Puccinia coronata f. sp. avenae TaxID=200324 RepID=A0A2N5SNV4_9BASI|nr:hypothetical protein PCANC_14790 [Puccinia coronata f. sp. avenae]